MRRLLERRAPSPPATGFADHGGTITSSKLTFGLNHATWAAQFGLEVSYP